MPDNEPRASLEPAVPAARGKSKVPAVVMILALLGAMMMGASLNMTWYTTKVEGGPNPFTADEDFGGYVTNGQRQAWGDMNGVNNSKAMYAQTEILVILGLVTAILLVIGGAMVMMNPKWKVLAVILGVLAILFTLIAPVQFMARHAPAWAADSGSSAGQGPQNSWSGSTDASGVKDSWGPNAGWMIALTGFAFTLLGAIAVFAVKGPQKRG